jgi:hypothetical protein
MDINQFKLRDVDHASHPGMRFALALVSSHGDDVRCIGTGFLVAPGLALTAAHIVQGWLDLQDQPRFEAVAFSVTAYQLFNDIALPWHVVRMHAHWTSDLAFLELARPDWWGDSEGQIRPPVARLNVNPPANGAEVRVFGFPGSFIEDRILKVTPAESVSRVRTVVMKSSACGFRPLSHVELDGEIQSGMSGGPCFDSEWNVVGVCSTGIDTSPDESPLATIALVWPVMALSIDLFGSGAFPAWNLFKEGPVQAVGHHRVHVTKGWRCAYSERRHRNT